ncbi:YdeI family protein [Pseudoduganella sp. UC29_71]|uniref:YdeI/OmpD-associated family protein n=1 Tax=Pseudoduganella sp. UC29_71 TaxID=3350174 RepID=UPI00366ACBC8
MPTAPMFFSDASQFRAWLEAHAASAPELLVGYHKVGSGKPSMSWSESVDEALCFGWIDGVRRRVDDDTYTIRFTPRRPTSIWSAINIEKMAKLRAEGRMTPAGEQAFALRSEKKSVVYSHEQAETAELSAAERKQFKAHAQAWQFFEATPPSYKKRLLHWVTSAKKEETRAGRLSKLVDACAAGERLDWSGKPT